MDILADLFREAGLRRRLLSQGHLPTDVALRFPCNKSMGFHVVVHGRAWVHAPGLASPLSLGAGDVVLMARGCDHLISPHESLRGLTERSMSQPEDSEPSGPAMAPQRTLSGESNEAAMLVSGAYQMWNAPLHPFFEELPAWHVVRGDAIPHLSPLSLVVALLGQEAGHQAPGAHLVAHGLLDALFTYLMRDLLDHHPAEAGFCTSQRDPAVRQAVGLLHADWAHPWSLQQLARQVGLSRTVLAGRFRQAMGDTPLNYLRTVRLQRAMRLLAEGDETLDHIAADVGYQDSFAFSKAFKRRVGVSPREFRQRDAADRSTPWRFTSTDAPAGGQQPAAMTQDRTRKHARQQA